MNKKSNPQSQLDFRSPLEKLADKHSFTAPGGQKVQFNPEIAISDVRRIAKLWDTNLINHGTTPQSDLPNNIVSGSKEHAWFLLFMASTDFRQDSVKLYKSVKNAIEENNDQFVLDPGNIRSLDTGTVQEFYDSRGIILAPTHKYGYVRHNAQTLLDNFSGGDLRVLNELAKGDVRFARDYLRDNFKGMGSGTSSLMTRFMMDSEMFTFNNPRELSIKVDTHKVRFPFMFGWYTTKDERPWGIGIRRGSLIKPLESMYLDIIDTATEGESNEAYVDVHRSFDEGLWRIGQTYCSKQLETLCLRACEMYESCVGRPQINSTSRNPLKRRNCPIDRKNHSFEFEGGDLYENPPMQEVYFIDNNSGELILSKQDYVYLFTDIREPLSVHEDQQALPGGEE